MHLQPRAQVSLALSLLLVSLLSASIVSAQQPNCSLKLDQLPEASELRGFRLGMSYDQLKARVPQIQFGPTDQFGVAKTSINPLFDPRFDKASFADVRTISLDFFDGRLVALWIGYERTFKWQTLNDFIAGISKALNLPGNWPPKRSGRELTCDGFTVFASQIAGSPSIRIMDETAQQTIADRREEFARAEELAVDGNTETKTYYPFGCAARENISASSKVAFKNKEDAEKAGFKLAKDCQ